MRHITITGLFLLLFPSLYSQSEKQKTDVWEQGTIATRIFQTIKDEVNHNGLNIKITPLDATDLNAEFSDEGLYDGRLSATYFEKSRSTYFQEKQAHNTPSDGYILSTYDFLLEGLYRLRSNRKISWEEYDELLKQIHKKYGKSSANIAVPDRNTAYNPYYLGERYLSLFEVTLTNTTNDYYVFEKDWIVEAGTELLSPLTKAEITDLLDQSGLLNVDKTIALERHHFSTSTTIPPNASFQQYLALLPLSDDSTHLKISFPGLQEKMEWSVATAQTSIDETNAFYEFDIKWLYDGYLSRSGINFNVIAGANDGAFLVNDKLYIAEDNIDLVFEIVSYSLKNDKLYFQRNKVKGTKFIKGENGLDRNLITLGTQRLFGLKRW